MLHFIWEEALMIMMLCGICEKWTSSLLEINLLVSESELFFMYMNQKSPIGGPAPYRCPYELHIGLLANLQHLYDRLRLQFKGLDPTQIFDNYLLGLSHYPIPHVALSIHL